MNKDRLAGVVARVNEGGSGPESSERALIRQQHETIVACYSALQRVHEITGISASAEILAERSIAAGSEYLGGASSCQNCGDLPWPGCNSEFSDEKCCLFWGPK